MNPSTPLLIATASLTAMGAQAGEFTTIQFDINKAAYERTHAQILSDQFGGDFTSVGNDFTNGEVYVTRVSDDMDQTYSAESWSAKTLATWAGAEQAFGTVDGGIAFEVTGERNYAHGEIQNVRGSDDIAFARFGDQKLTFRSTTDQAINPYHNDYVVTYTYSVNDDPVEDKYLLFFEDLANGDFDYNDLVVELTLNGASPIVPEPGSLALLGLSSLSMLRRRR